MNRRPDFFTLADLSDGIERELAPGVVTHIFSGDRAMLSIVKFEPNASGSLHAHPEEQWGVLLEGDGVRVQNGEEVHVRAGDFWRTPGETPHGFRAGPLGARILDIFSPPRQEYSRAGQGFGVEEKDVSGKVERARRDDE